MAIFEEIRKLETEGIDLIAILGGDTTISPGELNRILERLPRSTEDVLYSELIYFVTLQRFPEEEAKRLWNLTIRHKERLNRKLQRNVGFHVALLDYLSNKQSVLKSVRLLRGEDYERMAYLMERDSLTALYNRRFFSEQLDREIELTKRYRTHLSLLMLDLDHFKLYNDTKGHVEGDKALQAIAASFMDTVRTTDIACRYGGDEFAVICPRTVKHDALTLADRIREAVKKLELKPAIKQAAGTLTLSVGVATCPDDARETDALVKIADSTLFRAKREGEKLGISGTTGINPLSSDESSDESSDQ